MMVMVSIVCVLHALPLYVPPHPAQIDSLVEELLNHNLALMDKVETLAEQSELWRQTAESAALPGNMLG